MVDMVHLFFLFVLLSGTCFSHIIYYYFNFIFCHSLQLQVDLKLTEYHKLARKLKLIPQSAENACGHDFEIKSLECGPGSAVQHNVQTQVLPTNGPVHSSIEIVMRD